MNRALRDTIFTYLTEHSDSRIDAVAAGIGKPLISVRKCLNSMEFKKDVISTRVKRTTTVGASHKLWSINPAVLEPPPLNEGEQRKVDIIDYLRTHPYSSVRGICQGMHLRKGQVQYTLQALSKNKRISSKEELVKRKGVDVVRHLWYVNDNP